MYLIFVGRPNYLNSIGTIYTTVIHLALCNNTRVSLKIYNILKIKNIKESIYKQCQEQKKR